MGGKTEKWPWYYSHTSLFHDITFRKHTQTNFINHPHFTDKFFNQFDLHINELVLKSF